jgi:hypothetical protein
MIFTFGHRWRIRWTSSFVIARLCLAASMFEGRKYAHKRCPPQKTYSGR